MTIALALAITAWLTAIAQLKKSEKEALHGWGGYL